jgi:SAM-dependent methyltransferase
MPHMAPRTPRRWTKEQLYEAAVTNAPALARFFAGVHGKAPVLLGEDFAGTGALARAWAQAADEHHAIAVDHDPRVLAMSPATPRVRTITRDVHRVSTKVDILAATNFPIGYFHTRAALLRYLRHARTRLRTAGVFICDLYGGDGAFTPGLHTRRLRLADGTACVYHWDQRTANAATGMVENAIHFEVFHGKARVQHLRRAFVYHWRLWGIPELTDAMHEAGFASVEVYDRLGDAIDADGNLYARPLSEEDTLDPTWVVYLIARAPGGSQGLKSALPPKRRNAPSRASRGAMT